MLAKTRNLSLLILLILLSACASTSTSGSGGKQGNSLLWLVEYENQKVYILGSIHVADSSFYPLDSNITKAFDESTDLSVEIDIQNVNPGTLMQAATYKNNHTLEYNLNKQNFARVEKYLKNLGMPKLYYNKLKPWFVSFYITMEEMKRLGYDENLGIDNYFLKKARTSKRIHELESIEIQIELFEKISKDPNEYMEIFFDDFEHGIEIVDSLAAAWKSGDAKLTEKLLFEEMDNDERYQLFKEEMFTKRNKRMAKIIERYLAEDGKNIHFVVVGAGHLVGIGGVIDILKKRKMYEIKKF